ncbi:hypothetical protein [Streptomyces camponoticapitis]|uniref:hypothetical protein n=1 Tax=Streptomyces camponoticapitis TaxID=1616125 RepID=UPI00166F08A9|nr:hypothetical protein [Streptomyces camponoticapitis]
MAEEILIDGTPAGRAYATRQATQEKQEVGEAPARRWTPLLDGAERVGVLHVRTASADEDTAATVRRLAALVTLLLISVRSQSDSYARLVRTRRVTVAAEPQWNLMPPRAFANGQVTIAKAAAGTRPGNIRSARITHADDGTAVLANAAPEIPWRRQERLRPTRTGRRLRRIHDQSRWRFLEGARWPAAGFRLGRRADGAAIATATPQQWAGEAVREPNLIP